MRQETYRFALDEAAAELRDIVTQFEALKAKKEQIEKVVEALKPFIGLQAETPTIETSVAHSAPAFEQPTPEPVEFTFMQISGPGMEVTKSEPAPVEGCGEQVPEPVHAMAEATSGASCLFSPTLR